MLFRVLFYMLTNSSLNSLCDFCNFFTSLQFIFPKTGIMDCYQHLPIDRNQQIFWQELHGRTLNSRLPLAINANYKETAANKCKLQANTVCEC